MELYLNLILAWAAMIIVFIMAIIYFLRVLNKKKKIVWIKKLNRFLRRHHKELGIVLIIVGLVHGIFSSDKILDFNLGTVSWIASILIGLSFMFRSMFKPKKFWITAHRFLTVLFVALLVFHIIDVGGFKIAMLFEKPQQTEYGVQLKNNSIKPLIVIDEIIISDETAATNEVTTTEEVTATEEIKTSEPTATREPTKYIDGIYLGVADGYRSGLTVQIEIKDDVIISVEVIDHNEIKERFWSYPVQFLPRMIVQSQSIEVDLIAGATKTSHGIIDATNKALESALR